MHKFYLKFYIIFSLLSLLLILLPKKKKITTCVILFYIFLSLYLNEIILGYVMQMQKSAENKGYADKRSKIEVYNQLKKIDNKIVLSFIPSRLLLKSNVLFPFSGVSNRETLFCNSQSGWNSYTSDRYGFRNNDQDWDSATIDHVLVGDSIIHGLCVDNNNLISSNIQKLSQDIYKRKVSIINIGISGNGPLLEFASLKEYIPNKTKNILYFFNESNDFDDFSYEILDPLLIKYLQDDFNQDLKNKKNIANDIIEKELSYEIKDFDNNIYDFLKIKNIRFLAGSSLNYFFELNNSKKNFDFFNMDKLLKQYSNLAVRNGANLYLIYLPSYERYRNDKFNNNAYEERYKNFINIAKNNSINIIDIKEEFAKLNNPKTLYIKNNQHFNELGSAKIAKIIINKINF
jgi:hypothetical protein